MEVTEKGLRQYAGQTGADPSVEFSTLFLMGSLICCPYQFPTAGAMRLFGRDNITVSEFSNPAHRHFRSFSVARAECHVAGGGDTWHADDTW